MKSLLKLSVFLALTSIATAQQQSTHELQQPTARVRFVCNTGYSLQKCNEQINLLRSVLNKYPTELLGNWTWVLVRSEDWKTILRTRGLYDTAAFSYLPKRETFIEEALLSDENVSRRAELLLKWQMPMDRLLELAVTHELGHAICNQSEEAKADRYGALLRAGKPAVCEFRR